jgi:isopentenyl-diphosphate delta-isomerase
MGADMVDTLDIADRKRSHFDLCAREAVEFRAKTTLFEDVELIHHPLVETSLDEIDHGVAVLGKRLNNPIVITGMTGGTEDVGRFNREVAALAGRLGIAFGVGSQRIMFAHPEAARSFQVRESAPDLLLLGNLGIAQAREMKTADVIGLADTIGADAICIHLNAAMEIIQERGDQHFRRSHESIERLVAESPLEINDKETGCGFSRESGEKLASVGVRWIDVAGAGGTSWVGVETLRNRALRHLGEAFWDWGIPTAASVCELRDLEIRLIASGGLRNGVQAAKAIALGARLVGVALPVLRAYVADGIDGVELFLRQFCAELRAAVMLCGGRRIDDLTRDRAIIGGRLREWTVQRGLQ